MLLTKPTEKRLFREEITSKYQMLLIVHVTRTENRALGSATWRLSVNLTGAESRWRKLGWSESEDEVHETEDGE